jgi:hypothetical protein
MKASQGKAKMGKFAKKKKKMMKKGFAMFGKKASDDMDDEDNE